MPRYLVTGGAGFIGSNLVRLLLQDPDAEVMNLDALTYAGNRDSLKDIADDSRHHFVQVDLRDEAAVHDTLTRFTPDGIFHLAAETHVDRSIDTPGDFIQTNVLGTYHLLHAARELWLDPQSTIRNPKFLHVSTDEVFGSLGPDDPPFTESSRYAPRSPYSASKAASDHLVRAWHETYGLPVIVANCSNNYGPYQFPEKLIPLVILRAIAGKPIPVYGEGKNIRDWLHVGDQCRALALLMDSGHPGSTWNIGGGKQWTNLDLVKALCRILDDLRPRESGHPYEELIEFVPDRKGHDFRYAIDSSAFRHEFGWTPEHNLQDGLRGTVSWYLEHRDWWRKIIDQRYQLERLGLPAEPHK